MKFIVDRTVGKLGKYLRMLGFDVIYDPGGSREEMAARASNEERVILTRSQKNLGKGDPRGIRSVGSDNPRDQLAEVLGHFRLKPGANRFFSRCLFCNEELLPLAKERAEGKVPDFIYQAYDSFHLCPRCQRIYWPGTHYRRMKEDLAKIVE
ncbi:MAG: Mut7-C RNAse domain-containing protein [Deltaproteobacteria bacterium]|nr:Mut7-C RNAse domain-containing protein [Deltaproteobacteria bacterium]